MKRRSFLSTAAALPFTASALFAEEDKQAKPAEPKYLLRYRFKKGEVLRWNVLQTLKRKTSMNGMEETIETTSRSTKVWTVINLDDAGAATFEYKVDNVIMRQVLLDADGKKESQYDSRKDKDIPGMFINLDGTINVPLAHITIDVFGKTTKKPLREYGSASMENRIVIPLPKVSIPIGEYWTEPASFDIRLPDNKVIKVNARQKFILNDVQSGMAAIDFVTQILTPLSETHEWQLLDQNPDKFSSGKMKLDLDAGHFIRQETTIDKSVVNFSGIGSSIHHLSRLTECCCGLKSCELCSPKN